jgi:hypothetical protein
MKDEKPGMKIFDHSIYKMVINCCAQWKCMKYNKSWHSTTFFFGANIGNENDQQTWMKKNNEQIHNQNDNKGKDKVISMKCLDCRQETSKYDVSNFVPVIDLKASPSM